MRKFKVVVLQTTPRAPWKCYKTEIARLLLQDCFTVEYVEEILRAPNGSCGRCSAAVHGLPWIGQSLDRHSVTLGEEARLDTVHSLKAWQRWDLLHILLSGTAVRFGGHSYIWYQHSQIGSWHMHFRLKTHQLHAVVFYANGTDRATLEVRIATHRDFFPV